MSEVGTGHIIVAFGQHFLVGGFEQFGFLFDSYGLGIRQGLTRIQGRQQVGLTNIHDTGGPGVLQFQ